jgi:hypothetical protein
MHRYDLDENNLKSIATQKKIKPQRKNQSHIEKIERGIGEGGLRAHG